VKLDFFGCNQLLTDSNKDNSKMHAVLMGCSICPGDTQLVML